MRNIIVADSLAHAGAMMRWENLDPLAWIPAVYGDTLQGLFLHAKLIRPLRGFHEFHGFWLKHVLYCRVTGDVVTMTVDWLPEKQAKNEIEPPLLAAPPEWG